MIKEILNLSKEELDYLKSKGTGVKLSKRAEESLSDVSSENEELPKRKKPN